MSLHSIAPGRWHCGRPRPPWTPEYRHARRSELLWRASAAIESAVAALCTVVLVVAVVLVPAVLLASCDRAGWPTTDGPATTGRVPTAEVTP